jgi:dynein heavy chain
MLANCHLGLPFLATLEDYLVQKPDDEIGPDARILITSEPHKQFPIGLLQMSVKLTNEPPPGIKAGLKRTYGWFNQELLDSYRRPEWKPMLFTQCFIHSLVVERKKFGPIGFQIPYEFNQGDWQASVLFLQNHLSTIGDDIKKGGPVSWITVRYMISEIQYGGRITDNKDRVMFGMVCEVHMNEKILQPDFKFSGGVGLPNGYGIPLMEEYVKHKEFLEDFPEDDPPEVFGLHANADIIYRLRVSQQTLDTILEIQPRGAGGGGGKSPDDTVVEMSDDFLKRLPPEWRMDIVLDNFKRIKASMPLNIFARQEIERLNVAIKCIRVTLKDLKLAIAGVIVLSQDLSDARDALFDAKVPLRWIAVAWPSPTMGLWFEEVLLRHKQLDDWNKSDRPPKFWLTGFYNPQGFLTSMRQEVTRAHKAEGWALDDVVVKTEMQKVEKHEIDRPPPEGVFIYGLYLEGGGWDKGKQRLKEPAPKEAPRELPILYVTAIQGSDKAKPQKGKQQLNKFDCPCYKYPKRNDINWIFDVQLQCEEEKWYWQLRGICLLCSVD